jgi:hypothetical protein
VSKKAKSIEAFSYQGVIFSFNVFGQIGPPNFLSMAMIGLANYFHLLTFANEHSFGGVGIWKILEGGNQPEWIAFVVLVV